VIIALSEVEIRCEKAGLNDDDFPVSLTAPGALANAGDDINKIYVHVHVSTRLSTTSHGKQPLSCVQQELFTSTLVETKNIKAPTTMSK
jgi:hypothetical protein